MIPAAVHRLALRVAHALRKIWWRTAKPKLNGCCVIALDNHGRVMLVRHSYGNGHWMLPTGAIGRSEDARHAALREFREEVGCELLGFRSLGVVEHDLHGARNHLHLFTGKIRGTPMPDGREVIELAFFPQDQMPAKLNRTVAGLLARLDS